MCSPRSREAALPPSSAGRLEFFLVFEGELHIGLREPEGERTVVLPQGSVFTVPRGVEHKPYAPSRAAILVIEPSGTSTATGMARSRAMWT